MNIEFIKYDPNEEYYNIQIDNEYAGTFRIYKNPDFTYDNIKLYNFLGYILINKPYRQHGILTKIINDFNIKTLMVDNIDDIPKSTLISIYTHLGFKFLPNSNSFMIKT